MSKIHVNHGRDHRYYGADAIQDYDWQYVGTIGVDGVDAYLATQTLHVPFLNGWTNSLGPDAPVAFRLTMNGWVHLRGGFYGGADGTIVFNLPSAYRPLFQVPMLVPTGANNHYATVIVGTNGAVTFGTTV